MRKRLLTDSPVVILILLIFSPLPSSGKTPADPADDPADTSVNTLTRDRDVVILEGKVFQGIFGGDASGSVALYACRSRGFQRIPFQIDPIGDDGLVVSRYVNRIREKRVYDFVLNPDYPEHIPGRYDLLFMASDAGPRYTGASKPAGYAKAVEIRVEDSVDGGTGWVYMMKREALPLEPEPLVEKDYVDYGLVPKGDVMMEQVQGTGVIIGFPDTETS